MSSFEVCLARNTLESEMVHLLRRLSSQVAGRCAVVSDSQERHEYSARKPGVGNRLSISDEPRDVRDHSVGFWNVWSSRPAVFVTIATRFPAQMFAE